MDVIYEWEDDISACLHVLLKNSLLGVKVLKTLLSGFGIALVGRFAEWEYFNMDAAIASALAFSEGIGGWDVPPRTSRSEV